MKFKSFKRLLKKVTCYIFMVVTILLIFLGAWCLPPRMFAKVIESLKPKANVEYVLKKESDDDS